MKISATAGNIEPVCFLPISQIEQLPNRHRRLQPIAAIAKTRQKIVSKVIKQVILKSNLAVSFINCTFLRALDSDKLHFIHQTMSTFNIDWKPGCCVHFVCRFGEIYIGWRKTGVTAVLEDTPSKNLGRGGEPLCENAKIDNTDLETLVTTETNTSRTTTDSYISI